MLRATSLKQLPGFGIHRIAIACGVFDGLHLGHQEIIGTMRSRAKSAGAESVVVTFAPHPDVIVNPGRATKLLYSKSYQLHLLDRIGVQVVVVLPFTKKLAALQPEQFISELVDTDGLQITDFCVGDGWRFGYQAAGDTALLAELGKGYGFNVIAVPERIDDDAKISSSRVRKALLDGQLGLAKALLGRNFSLLGRVEFGKGIATSDLCYPTANIASENEIFPPNGVYAAKAVVFGVDGSAQKYSGVIYLGDSPTFVEPPPETPFVEIHLFDFNEEIYGQRVEVEFIEFLRPDEKFETIDALKNQIGADVSRAKDVLAALA